MSRVELSRHGRATIIEESLTDGSKVYNVEILADSGELIVASCVDKTAASRFARGAAGYTVDISVRPA